MTTQVISANLNGSKASDTSAERVAAIGDLIDRTADATLLLLQEAVDHDLAPLARLLPGGASRSWMCAPTESDPARQMGLLTAWSGWLADAVTVRMPNPRLERIGPDGQPQVTHDKGAIVASAGSSGSAVGATVVNLHGIPFQSFGTAEDAALVRATWLAFTTDLEVLVDTTPHLIMAGDFNLDDRSILADVVEAAHLTSLFERAGTRPGEDDSPDDIYVGRDVEVRSTALHPIGSDHLALVAEVELLR